MTQTNFKQKIEIWQRSKCERITTIEDKWSVFLILSWESIKSLTNANKDGDIYQILLYFI